MSLSLIPFTHDLAWYSPILIQAIPLLSSMPRL